MEEVPRSSIDRTRDEVHFQQFLGALLRQSQEAFACSVHFIKAEVELLNFSWKKAILGSITLVILLAVIFGILFMGILLTSYGIALGLGRAMGDRFWLGSLATGIFLSLLLYFSFRLFSYHWKKKSFQRKVEDYERRRNEHQSKFGSERQPEGQENVR